MKMVLTHLRVTQTVVPMSFRELPTFCVPESEYGAVEIGESYEYSQVGALQFDSLSRDFDEVAIDTAQPGVLTDSETIADTER